jgi:hypothetical protein
MKRGLLATSLALLILAGAQQPAHASGDPALVAFMLIGVLLAQVVEGVVVAVIAARRLPRESGILVLFFALGCVAMWWFVLSSPASNFIAGFLLGWLPWLLLLLAGPASALVAGVIVRAAKK